MQYTIFVNSCVARMNHIERGKLLEKMGLFSKAVENDKIPVIYDKNLLKSIYHWELLMKLPQVCYKISNHNWFLAQSRKSLPLYLNFILIFSGFPRNHELELNSYLNLPMKLCFSYNSWKFSEQFQYSLLFRLFLINSLGSGAPHPRSL